MREKIKEIWREIVKRCTEGSYVRTKKNLDTYEGCTLSDEWKVFDNFYNWYVSQLGYDQGYEVDKDILIKGNKVYSSATCVLIPKIINSAITNSKKARGDLPLGVSMHVDNQRFVARCRYVEDGERKRKTIGYYETSEEAFKAYKEFKEKYLKQLADHYRATISDVAYQAVINYKVEISD